MSLDLIYDIKNNTFKFYNNSKYNFINNIFYSKRCLYILKDKVQLHIL